MSYYAGIDAGLEYAHVCVVDADGQVVHEGQVASEPAALVEHLRQLGVALARVGLEAGPLAQWLFDGLAAAVCQPAPTPDRSLHPHARTEGLDTHGPITEAGA